jgi:Protein of unknown function (DUF3300)
MKKHALVELFPSGDTRAVIAIFCALLLVLRDPVTLAQAQVSQPAPASNNQPQQLLPPEQLDSLVAPVALYPDNLLSQMLVASTYPLEIVEASRWMRQNSGLKGQALTEAASKQSWDASVQALVVFPDVLTKLDQNISWTTDLGNAFLNQEADVMGAIQRLRQTAQQRGKLNTTPQQNVSTVSENNASYIVIQPADPQVIYVPQYDPTVIWGPPPAYYPYPSTGAIVASSLISFGAGVAVGALFSGGYGWGWGFGWGNRSVTINNNFIRSNRFTNVNVANGNQWRHNPAHRAGVPYNSRAVSNRYNQGRPNVATRPNVAQTQQRLGQAQRQATGQGMAQRQGQGAAQRQAGQGNRGLAQSPAARPGGGRGTGSASRTDLGGAAGARMGNRQVGGGSGRGAFGDMNMGGGRAHMNANRGASSAGRMGGGGGFRGGGGGRGGGRRR